MKRVKFSTNKSVDVVCKEIEQMIPCVLGTKPKKEKRDKEIVYYPARKFLGTDDMMDDVSIVVRKVNNSLTNITWYLASSSLFPLIYTLSKEDNISNSLLLLPFDISNDSKLVVDLYVIPTTKSTTPSFPVSIRHDFEAFWPIEVPQAAVAVFPSIDELKNIDVTSTFIVD